MLNNNDGNAYSPWQKAQHQAQAEWRTAPGPRCWVASSSYSSCLRSRRWGAQWENRGSWVSPETVKSPVTATPGCQRAVHFFLLTTGSDADLYVSRLGLCVSRQLAGGVRIQQTKSFQELYSAILQPLPSCTQYLAGIHSITPHTVPRCSCPLGLSSADSARCGRLMSYFISDSRLLTHHMQHSNVKWMNGRRKGGLQGWMGDGEMDASVCDQK